MKEQAPGPRAIFDFLCCSTGYVCTSEDLLSILLTNNCTRINMITGIIEICITAICLEKAHCEWIGKLFKHGFLALLYALASGRWFLIYIVSNQNTHASIMGC